MIAKNLKFLIEELSFDQKKMVDRTVSEMDTPEIHKHLPDFLKKNDTIIHHLSDDLDSVPIHPEVEKHLNDNGFKIASNRDYASGYAVDPHARIISIGKALKNTKASEEITKSFVNDPHRALAKKSQLSIAYTRNPYHVAGMSTDRGWTSCMDLNGGINAHYVPDEISAGTHAAYLIHKDDKGIENPIARIALKPFRSNESGHMVLRPEKHVYGTASDKFHDAVKEFAETHFPTKPDETYVKHHAVYNDGMEDDRSFGAHSEGHIDNVIHRAVNEGAYHELRPISFDGLKKGIQRLPEKSKARKEANEVIGYHQRANAAVAHVVDEYLKGNTHKSIFENPMNGDLREVPHEHVNALIDKGVHMDSDEIAKHLMQHTGTTTENSDKIFKEKFNQDASKLDGDEIHRPSKLVTSALMKYDDGGRGPASGGNLWKLRQLCKSEHTNFTKLKPMIVSALDELPANRISNFTSSTIKSLKTNPNYTIEHAKAIDRGLNSLNHRFGEAHAMFTATHPDAEPKHYDTFMKELPEHDDVSKNATRALIKNLPSHILHHALATHPDPAEFSKNNFENVQHIHGQASSEMALVGDDFNPMVKSTHLSNIDMNKLTNPKLHDHIMECVKEIADEPNSVRGNIDTALRHSINVGHIELASKLMSNYGDQHRVPQQHVNAFKAKFPEKAAEIDSAIASGSMKVKGK